MRRLIIIAAFIAACTPLTEVEREEATYNQQEHEVAWRLYEKACKAVGGHVYWKTHRPCTRRECIPARHEWRHWYDEDGKLHWNSASIDCVR